MKHAAKVLTATSCAFLLLAALAAAPAIGDEGFGLKGLDLTFTNPDGSPAMQAGSHPYAMTVTISVNTTESSEGGEIPIDAVRDLETALSAGLVGDPRATPRCSGAEFADIAKARPACSDSAAVGVVVLRIGAEGPESFASAVYNLVPPPGVVEKLGFVALGGVPVTIEVGINPNPPYNAFASATKIAQPLRFYGAVLSIWGNPPSPAHDPFRGRCLNSAGGSLGTCKADVPERPFLTLPGSCMGPLLTRIEADSWQNPGTWLSYILETHNDAEPPAPLGPIGCANLGFAPHISAQPTTDQAESPSGLNFNVDFNDEGLINPDGIAQSDIKKAVVTLPKGVTANPSLAEGLAACSEADLARETLDSEPGEGCPEASKIGTVEVETPLLEGELINGQVFVATQDENPFGSLIALYMVIKDPELGILVKLPGKVEPDPQTGQLVTTFGEPPFETPQFPFSHFRFHFREGGRSPLITPPGCGSFEAKAEFTPWSDPSRPLTTTASFQITRGTGGGPCPPAGPPPFAPGFAAGSLSNEAGHYSPFYMRLTRRDGDQDLTRFDATLPPGMLAKLAGVSQCPEAAIAAAKAKTGRAELASPSCPASSQIGRVLSGAGVGSQLTYVGGKLYLAGPFGGAPLSVVAVVPAVAGPFDVGTVVVREALQINPRTAAVRADGAHSDPIPHILAGIPLKVRDIRVYVDRPEFTLNPTSCEPSEVAAQIWGGGANVFSSADDAPVSLAQGFHAANCANLGFKPRLSLRLKGGTKRGDHPELRTVFRPRPGDANLSDLILRLPHSAFLDQAHIRTVCTRVQYAAKSCPPGAVYGHARAFTPLLEAPLEGPIYLRSSNHKLPDLVFALHGLVDVEAVARIDSKAGGIRAAIDNAPDAPISKVVASFPSGKKGLIVNSRNLCAHPSRADARMSAHNGRLHDIQPLVQPSCGKLRKRHRHR